MANWLKLSTTVTIRLGPALDKTDGVTEETALSPTVEISKNHGAFAARNSATAITHDSNGWYAVELNTTDTNTLGPFIAKFDDAATHLPVWREFLVVPANVYDSLVGGTDTLQADVTQWLGTAAATPTVAGVPEVDVTHWIGTAAATPTVAGVPEVDVTHVGGTVQTAGDIIGDTNDLQARIPAALVGGRMDSSVGAMAANVLTAAATAADFSTEVRSLASGTADSGTTTTMVDAARTEADTDYWKGSWIVFTSGTLLGQSRLITAFDPATDTTTFAPATTVAVGTHTYEIWPAARVDLHLWLGAVANALIAGRVDANTQALAAGVIAAATFAAGAIDAAAVATDAIGSAEFAQAAADKIWASAARTLTAATNITSTGGTTVPQTGDSFARLGAPAGASVSADILTLNDLTDDLEGRIPATLSELSQAIPPATPTLAQAIMLLYMSLRNELTTTATQMSIKNDAGTVICKATLSDDGTVHTRTELVAGP